MYMCLYYDIVLFYVRTYIAKTLNVHYNWHK